MCEICHKYPCDSRCPNAKPRKIYICSGCGQPIYEGEYVWQVMGEQYCENCIEGVKEIAEMETDE